MKIDEIRDEIINTGLVINGVSHLRKLQNYNSQLIETIRSEFINLVGRNPIKISEAIYCFYYDLKPTKCVCGIETNYIDFKNGYNKSCSSRCAALNSESQKKLRETNLIRYGVDNASKSPEIQQKFKKSMMDRYGVDNPSKSEEIRSKTKATNVIKYGVESPLQNKEIREKGKDTLLVRYGVNHPLKSVVFMNKQRETNLERRGVEYPTQNALVIAKSVETNLRNYGVENAMQREEVRDKAKETWAKNYGVAHPMLNQNQVDKMLGNNVVKYGVASTSQIHYSSFSRETLFNEDIFTDFMNGKSLNEASNILDIDASTVSDYCKKYSIIISRSSYETEIAAFLDSLNVTYLNNTRSIIKPKELDFYLPDYNIAIEFNSLYWHSHEFLKDKNYHLNKFLDCQALGIQLISINEDEWIKRSIVIKNKIKNMCNIMLKGAAARKLKISQIDNSIGNIFVDRYHIQGESTGIISSFGAYDNTSLVGVIQFSKQRNTGDIELVRFCSDESTHAGMFSKLLAHAIKSQSYTKIISFADRRYSSGNLYEKNGFKLVNTIPPDYRYIKNLNTFHKSTFQKSKIQKKFGLDMSNLTESDAMLQLGYRKIYDCGKIKYEWKMN